MRHVIGSGRSADALHQALARRSKSAKQGKSNRMIHHQPPLQHLRCMIGRSMDRLLINLVSPLLDGDKVGDGQTGEK